MAELGTQDCGARSRRERKEGKETELLGARKSRKERKTIVKDAEQRARMVEVWSA